MPNPSEQARISGAVLRSYVKELERAGVKNEVRARLKGPIAAHFDAPPGFTEWLPAEHLSELLKAIGEEIGREKLRKMALSMARNGSGPIVQPILRTVLALAGASPVALYKRLDTIIGVQLKGARFQVVGSAASSASIKMEAPYPLHDFECAGWEGVLLYGHELCKVTGDVRTEHVTPDQHTATFRATWAQ